MPGRALGLEKPKVFMPTYLPGRLSRPIVLLVALAMLFSLFAATPVTQAQSTDPAPDYLASFDACPPDEDVIPDAGFVRRAQPSRQRRGHQLHRLLRDYQGDLGHHLLTRRPGDQRAHGAFSHPPGQVGGHLRSCGRFYAIHRHFQAVAGVPGRHQPDLPIGDHHRRDPHHLCAGSKRHPRRDGAVSPASHGPDGGCGGRQESVRVRS